LAAGHCAGHRAQRNSSLATAERSASGSCGLKSRTRRGKRARSRQRTSTRISTYAGLLRSRLTIAFSARSSSSQVPGIELANLIGLVARPTHLARLSQGEPPRSLHARTRSSSRMVCKGESRGHILCSAAFEVSQEFFSPLSMTEGWSLQSLHSQSFARVGRIIESFLMTDAMNI
jgi:hypothetical protein